jgi:hypothetical protein
MKTLIGWLAIAALIYFVYWILRRILRFIFTRSQSTKPLPDQLADVAEDVAAASRVAAALSTAAAFFAAPAGLLAIGAALGVVPTPFIIRILPVLGAFAFGAAALSALAKLFAKSRRK